MPNLPPSAPRPASASRLLYDRKEAARQLSISLRSLDYLIAESGIRCLRLKGRVLISNVTGTPNREPQSAD